MVKNTSTQLVVRNSESIVSLLSTSRAFQAVVFSEEDDGVSNSKDLFNLQDCQGESLALNLDLFDFEGVRLTHELALNFDDQVENPEFELFRAPRIGAEKPGQFTRGEFVANSNEAPGRAAMRAANDGVEVEVGALRRLHSQMDDNDVPYWYGVVYGLGLSDNCKEKFALALVPSYSSRLVLLLVEEPVSSGTVLKPRLMYTPSSF